MNLNQGFWLNLEYDIHSLFVFIYRNKINVCFSHLAYYNPDEDVSSGKLTNGFLNEEENVENNNGPVCVQPLRVQRNFSTIR